MDEVSVGLVRRVAETEHDHQRVETRPILPVRAICLDRVMRCGSLALETHRAERPTWHGDYVSEGVHSARCEVICCARAAVV
jgi:hypothetical protein